MYFIFDFFLITYLSSSETTGGTTNDVTYQNIVVSDKLSASNDHQKTTAGTTTIQISKEHTTKQPSSGIS